MRFVLNMKSILFLVFVLVSSCSIQPPKLAEDQLKAEANEVVQFIKLKPDWIDFTDICPSEVVPTTEIEIQYLGEKCESGPKQCFEKCKKDDGNACYALALFLQKQKGIDVEEANLLFLHSCKLGVISGCTNVAAFKLNSESKLRTNSSCPADTFEKTCAKNDHWGCSMFGMILADGIGRKQNTKDAIKYLDKACISIGADEPACDGAMKLKKQIEDSENKRPTK
jgi:hypothetical protein